MKGRSVDQINIGLMLISCLLAFIFPFQLFLFSYAVLGPLHYFTEIPWLEKKQFYTRGKYDFLLLVLATILIAGIYYMTPSDEIVKPDGMKLIAVFTFIAFFGALVMTTMKTLWQKAAAIILIAGSTFIFNRFGIFGMIFGNFIPSIIHVYLFTGAFILLGALKHKSAAGIFSLVVFALCTAAIFLVSPDPQMNRSLSLYVKSSYLLFAGLNFDLMNFFGMQHVTPDSPGLGDILFFSDTGIIIMRLIAFSYTYHFLNWFSKTSVIKWHQISKRGIVIVLVLWAGSLAIYAIDYKIGLRYLYALSLLHVLLEFPLNHRTFIGIGQELKARFVKRDVATAT
ncbi:MAG TPA: hypothetical protein VEW28_06115 [Candidatus Kapabacteria bacterium]|nr:hypothetical protein [Candidatus Kapabacteria bacterium]